MNRCRVVLVRTEIAANIGSAARVMRNMGAHELVLVDPVADPASEHAEQLATHHARDLLRAARVTSSLEDALAGCVSVVGTSARTGGLFRRQTVATPREVMPQLAVDLRSGPVGLLFGPEPSGLNNDEVARCHYLVHIPTDDTYPALNLAQAVAICLYELRTAWLALDAETPVPDIAPFDDLDRMFTQMEDGLRQIRYLRGLRADALMYGIRHLISRARPSPMEVGLLLGLARQMQWFARRANLPPEADDEPSGG